jgi:hypothetical protein
MDNHLTSLDYSSEDVKRFQHIPVGQYDELAEVSNLVAFILSDAANHVTARV